ncbi:MAG: (2Fe-2S)-binding protein [Nannocystaceae bacterium]
MTDRTFVCRCEDVTVKELDHALELGLTTIEEIKRYTGLGTGPCQGRECLVVLARRLIDRGLATPASIQPFTARPPSEPVTLGALASAQPPYGPLDAIDPADEAEGA